MGDADDVIVEGASVKDTQDWSTKTDGASFIPGTSDAADQYEITLVDPRQIEVGQHIVLKNVDGGDETVKVVNQLLDEITVEFTAAVTLQDTGNLTSLSGTFSSSGQTLTGSGSALDTEITGRTVIKADPGGGAEYRIIRRVNSATSAVLETAFSGDLSADTAEKVTIDVDAIASQQNGIRIETTASNYNVRNCDTRSNVGNQIIDAGGTNPSIRQNRGHVTENSGFGTINAGGGGPFNVTITHGLAVQPALDDISVISNVNPTADPGNIWVDTLTSTQFNINCRNDPVSNMSMAWRVAISPA